MAENLPEVGKTYEYKGQQAIVASVQKRGRGYRVNYTVSGPEGSILGTARLKDWQKGAQ